MQTINNETPSVAAERDFFSTMNPNATENEFIIHLNNVIKKVERWVELGSNIESNQAWLNEVKPFINETPQTIKVNRGFYTNTLTETEVSNVLDENKLLKSILLMVINGDDTWENGYEVEFTRAEAVDFLKTANIFKGYDQQYIQNTLAKITK